MTLRRLRKELQGFQDESAAPKALPHICIAGVTVVGARGGRGGSAEEEEEEGVGVPTWQLSPSFYSAFPVLKVERNAGEAGGSSSGGQSGSGGGGDDPMAHFDLFRWRAVIIGPPKTPYEGGLFELTLTIPDNYPFTPIKVHFVTRIFHPNVCVGSGAVSLPIFADRWAPGRTIRSVLLELVEMLRAPSLDYFLNAEATELYRDGLKGVGIGRAEGSSVIGEGGGGGQRNGSALHDAVNIGGGGEADTQCASPFATTAREWTRYYALGF